jgi:hypothetical protein
MKISEVNQVFERKRWGCNICARCVRIEVMLLMQSTEKRGNAHDAHTHKHVYKVIQRLRCGGDVGGCSGEQHSLGDRVFP